PPESCLAVTFTRRARDELRDRLTALLGADAAARVTVATFHGLGLLILREQCKLIGLDAGLKVADERTRGEVLRLLAPTGSPVSIGNRISAAKRLVASRVSPPADSASTGGALSADPAEVDAELTDLVARYDAALRERGMVDLDDLVTLPTTLLAADTSLAVGYRSRWTDVFVDEYQDVDEQQYLLLRQLAAPGARICAIGDPDQAIYGFRGGDVRYFLRFQQDFGGATGTPPGETPVVARASDVSATPAVTVRLSRSYRSAPTIVRAAMQLIRPGTLVPGRELIPARTDIPDGPVVVHAVADEREEAGAVAAEIEKLLGGASFHALDSRTVDGRDRAEHQLSFADFAVLYRTSSQAVVIGEALARRGFPFQRRAHSRLAEMPGVAAILAALTPSDALTPAVPQRAPSPVHGCEPHPYVEGEGSGSGSVAERVAIAAGAVLAATETASGADAAERAEAIIAIRAAAEVLGQLAAKCGTDLDRFLDELQLGAEVDTWDPRADRISLLTLHAAKGLEFPVVFIAGCDDRLLPLRSWPRASWSRAEVDHAEERRLLFVGMTRATTRLTLYTAAKRTLRGEFAACSPSPFLSSVDQALIDRRGGEGQGRGRRRPRAQQPTLF
ncbi:MAG: ATP-dependent helicase, partial [Trebonia sp.]